jgi:hypothetical protein
MVRSFRIAVFLYVAASVCGTPGRFFLGNAPILTRILRLPSTNSTAKSSARALIPQATPILRTHPMYVYRLPP